MLRSALCLACLLPPAIAVGQTSDVALGCAVSGYDVVITNTTAAPLPAGSTLGWAVRFARLEGAQTLTVDLAPGATVFMTAVLGSNYLSARTPCRAWIIAG
jgi:hypothetical protein